MEEMKKQSGKFQWNDPGKIQWHQGGGSLRGSNAAIHGNDAASGLQGYAGMSVSYNDSRGPSQTYNASNVLTASSNP